jgi:curli biogenesis system outer membrane secretion channel CsgG
LEKNGEAVGAQSPAAPPAASEATPPPQLTPAPMPSTTPPPPPAPVEHRSGAPVKRRPSLAVLPFTVATDDFWKYFKEPDVESFTDKFIASLVNTHKFDIIERSRLEDLMAEQKLSRSGAVDPERLTKSGRLIGADYIVIGTVSVFKTNVDYRPIPYTSRFNETLTADVVVDLRIVNASTGKILATPKGDVSYSDKTMVDSRREGVVTPRFLDDLQRSVIKQLTKSVSDTIAPARQTNKKK